MIESQRARRAQPYANSGFSCHALQYVLAFRHMGIRETLNQKPGITTGATAGIILVALGIIVWQLFGTGSSTTGGGAGQPHFSDDDRQILVADHTGEHPPFLR